MLQLDDVCIGYGDRSIVQNVSLHITKGELVSIIGPNGTGKSTLLKAISKRLKVSHGNIVYDKQNIKDISISRLAQVMCMVSQGNTCPEDIKVRELVEYGRLPYKKWYERMNSNDYSIVEWALEQCNLTSYAKRNISSLSGGEAQRAWIAMGLAQQPQLLLLDEPTTYLDIAHQVEVLELIRRLNKELGITIVMVLHDLNHAIQYSDKVCVLHKGQVYDYGSAEQVIEPHNIREVYRVEAQIDIVANVPRVHILKKVM